MKKCFFLSAVFIVISTIEPAFILAQNSNNSQYILQPGYHISGQTNTTIPNNSNGNNIITGNVRDGKSFQGNIPYNSTSSLSTTLGTATLRSFMRDSAGSEDIGRYTTSNTSASTGSNYRPYHLPSQTVTTMSQSNTAVSDYTNSASGTGLQNISKLQTSLNQNKTTSLPDSSNTSISNQQYNPQSTQIQNQLYNPYLQTNPALKDNSEEFNRRLENISDQLDKMQQELHANKLGNNTDASENMQSFMPNISGYEIASTSELYTDTKDKSVGNYQSMTSFIPYQSQVGSALGGINQQKYQSNNFTGTEQYQTRYDSLDNIRKKLDDLTRAIDTHMQSESVGSERYNNTNFQSYSQSQFNIHFNNANENLQNGKYYDAANSFTLAAVYEPDNPYCYGGQAHALFAAGQYVSSSLFIIRAIDLNPEYIYADIDLAEIAGGLDMLNRRIAELQQLIQNGPATGLQFLLGYVYYKTNRLADARQIINAAYQETPQSRAIVALKMAIDVKFNSQS